MAGSPKFKVYSPSREYVAACKYANDAAVVVSLYGDGATVKWQHNVTLWTEGSEEQPAGNGYDEAADTMHARMDAHNRKAYARYHQPQES